MRRARSSILLVMTCLAPVSLAAPVSAESVAFAAELVGDAALEPFAIPPPAASAPVAPPHVVMSGPQVMTDADMSEARGGFMTAGGFTFGFGVVVRSYVNDQLALQTQLTWTPTGPVSQQVQHNVPGVADLAGAMASLVAGGIDLRGLNNTGGVAVVDGSGATAILHNITTSQLQNLIINNADNRNIRQDMELNLVLPDLATIQTNSQMHNYGSNIARDIDWAGLRSLGGF